MCPLVCCVQKSNRSRRTCLGLGRFCEILVTGQKAIVIGKFPANAVNGARYRLRQACDDILRRQLFELPEFANAKECETLSCFEVVLENEV